MLSFRQCISGVMGAIFLLGTASSFAAFYDVNSSHENYDAILYVQNEHIVSGYADGTFRPQNLINRAEFTKIIIVSQFGAETINNCIAENTKSEDTVVFFSDVSAENWFTPYVCVAKVHNIVNGYPDGTFHPEQNISLVEAAKIIVSAFGFAASTDEIWYRPFIEQLNEKNALPISLLAFDQNITRGEMAEMIYRLKTENTEKASTTYSRLAGISEESDSTVGTYQNENQKYTLEYPAKYTVTDQSSDQSFVEFFSTENDYFTVAAGPDYELFYETEFAGELTIGDLPAQEYILEGGVCTADVCTPPVVAIKILANDLAYTIAFYGTTTIESEQQAILDSFMINTNTDTMPESTPAIHEFTVSAKSWAFDPNVITVKKGETVRLHVTSLDVNHGFALSEFGINEHLTPGQTVTIEFVADKAGTFTFFCSVFCGAGHSTMKGTFIVEE